MYHLEQQQQKQNQKNWINENNVRGTLFLKVLTSNGFVSFIGLTTLAQDILSEHSNTEYSTK